MSKHYTVRSHKKFPHPYPALTCVTDQIKNLESFGNKTMFIWKENGEKKSLSYEGFAEMVYRFSDGLVRLYSQENPTLAEGLDSSIRIGIIGETSPQWIAAYLGILLAGGVAIPLDKELDPKVIGEFLDSVDATALVYSSTFNSTFAAMPAEHRTVRYGIAIQPTQGADAEGLVSYDSILTSGANAGLTKEEIRDSQFARPMDTQRLAEMLFTSGTTGSSKCVMLCQKNIYAAMVSATATVDFTADDSIVSVLPIHHTYELCCLMAATSLGMLVYINDSLRHVLNNFKEYKPTGLVLVPLFLNTMYKKIQSEAKRNGKEKALAIGTKVAGVLNKVGVDVSEKLFGDIRQAFGGNLKKIICGGAAMDPSLIPIFESFGISIYEGYGITECAPLVAVTPYYKRKCGSIGPAVPCCEVRIEGFETNEAGYVVGEIQVKGDNVMMGYYNNPDANADAFTEDGWFRTGDIGFMDKDNYLTVTGRMKSVIVLDNGKNVFPEEIEEYLEKIPLICESVVVGREVEDGSIKLTAVIFPNLPLAEEKGEEFDIYKEIQKEITALNKQLPSFKQIHKLEFRKTEFEKTSTKKIKRFLV